MNSILGWVVFFTFGLVLFFIGRHSTRRATSGARFKSLVDKNCKRYLPSWLQAIAAIILCGLTWYYVQYTSQLVQAQNKQFELINRARIGINRGFPDGDIRSGVINFVNVGNLDADDCRVAWQLIKVHENKIQAVFPEEPALVEQKVIEPEQTFSIRYESTFRPEEQVLFLVVAWKYQGAGINSYRYKEYFYLWNNLSGDGSKVWSTTGALDQIHERLVADTKNRLREVLD